MEIFGQREDVNQINAALDDINTKEMATCMNMICNEEADDIKI